MDEDNDSLVYCRTAEESLLGQMLRDPKIIPMVQRFLPPDRFYSNQAQIIATRIYDVIAETGHVDIVTLAECLRRWGELGLAGGSSRLCELADAAFSSAGAKAYVQIVLEYWICRQVSERGRELMGLWEHIAVNVQDALKASRKTSEAIDQGVEDLDALKRWGLSAIECLNREMEGR